jgi:hypothetical protein
MCLGLVSCTLLNDLTMSEKTEALCMNGRDDDNDTLTDCADAECQDLEGFWYCSENWGDRCIDGIDNDHDDIIDCEDHDCFETGVCPENDVATCTDGADNDNDDAVDCSDKSCWEVIPSTCYEVEDIPIIDVSFDDGGLEQWRAFSVSTPTEPPGAYRGDEIVEVGDGHLHIAVEATTDSTEDVPVREEAGLCHETSFDVWRHLTNIVLDVSLDLSAEPALIALALSSLEEQGPFERMGQREWSVTHARASVLFLRIDGRGGIQVCSRASSDSETLCIPESGPIYSDAAIADRTTSVTVKISKDFLSVVQDRVERIRTENPYGPGMARLCILASTDSGTSSHRSELFLDQVRVYQFPAEIEQTTLYAGSFGPEEAAPDWDMLEGCQIDEEQGYLEVVWDGSLPEGGVCMLDFRNHLEDRSMQANYEFQIESMSSGALFLPGFWDSTSLELGMPLAAGIREEGGGLYFLLEACDAEEFVSMRSWDLSGMRVRADVGLDPVDAFSYVVFREVVDGEPSSDLWSSTAYGTECYGLTMFGMTGRSSTEQSVAVILDDVVIEQL